jgi:uncharacterized protein involved in exopolysaccharide biosynthesis
VSVDLEVGSAESLSAPVIIVEKPAQPKKQILLAVFGLLGALGVGALVLALLYFLFRYLF